MSRNGRRRSGDRESEDGAASATRVVEDDFDDTHDEPRSDERRSNEQRSSATSADPNSPIAQVRDLIGLMKELQPAQPQQPMWTGYPPGHNPQQAAAGGPSVPIAAPQPASRGSKMGFGWFMRAMWPVIVFGALQVLFNPGQVKWCWDYYVRVPYLVPIGKEENTVELATWRASSEKLLSIREQLSALYARQDQGIDGAGEQEKVRQQIATLIIKERSLDATARKYLNILKENEQIYAPSYLTPDWMEEQAGSDRHWAIR